MQWKDFRSKEIIEIAVYSKDGLLLEKKQTKDPAVLEQPYEKNPADKKAVFKKISSSFSSFSFSGKNTFEFFSPVMTSSINPDNANNIFLDEKSLVEKNKYHRLYLFKKLTGIILSSR